MKRPVFSQALMPLPQCSPRFSARNPAHRKEHPRFALVDDFTRKTTDIDGDKIPDLSHGEMNSRIIRMLQPDAEVVPFKVQPKAATCGKSLIENLQRVASRIREGERFDGVALPMGYMTPLSKRNHSLSALRKPWWERIRDRIVLPGWKNRQAVRKIENITGKGVPVYIGAGNKGADFFNILSLARKSISVGAMGARFNQTDYSADNPWVNCFARGTYNIYKADGGYDLNGDGIPEVLDCEVSGRGEYVDPHIAAFAGKRLDSVLANENDWAELKSAWKARELDRIPQRLFPLDRLKAEGFYSQSIAEMGTFGDFLAFFQKPNGKIGFQVFRTNQNGEVIYSPDGSLNRSAVHYTWGTSSAAPSAMAADWQARTFISQSPGGSSHLEKGGSMDLP